MLKQIIKKVFSSFGYSLEKKIVNRMTLEGGLKHIASIWRPDLVIDVGAAFGEFSKKTAKIFSHAQYILCEPLYEYREILERLIDKKGWIYIPKAMGEYEGKIDFFVHKDLVGSSTKREIEGPKVDGEKRTVDITTLDLIGKEYHIEGEILLKIDVQGAELHVLRGANSIIEKCECIILEVSFFKSLITGSDIYEIVCFMKDRGFVVYDITSFLYRPYDGALSQADMIFVKENGVFRQFHGYATPEQRKKQDEKFKKEHKLLLN